MQLHISDHILLTHPPEVAVVVAIQPLNSPHFLLSPSFTEKLP